MVRKFRDYFVIGLKGMAMGAADVVPGVSGGTIGGVEEATQGQGYRVQSKPRHRGEQSQAHRQEREETKEG